MRLSREAMCTTQRHPQFSNSILARKSAGWQHHAVGYKRVHVILPSEKTLGNPRTLMSLMEMRHRGWMHRARLDASKIMREKEDDAGDGTSEFVAAENMYYSKSHLLHGVFHMNGYGHLCRVNGREGGSSKYTGTELMHVWDELCTVLRMHKVSVEDVSNKLTMELRILLPLSCGNTWYGRWGYEFGRSPFNVKADQWQKAVVQAATVKIEDLIEFCSCFNHKGECKPRRGWKHIFAVLLRYHNAPLLSKKQPHRSVANTGTEVPGGQMPERQPGVLTVGDLLEAMMDALRKPEDKWKAGEPWYDLLVVSGNSGQRPEEEKAPEVTDDIKEQALLAAFRAQETPSLYPEAFPEIIQDEEECVPASEVNAPEDSDSDFKIEPKLTSTRTVSRSGKRKPKSQNPGELREESSSKRAKPDSHSQQGLVAEKRTQPARMRVSGRNSSSKSNSAAVLGNCEEDEPEHKQDLGMNLAPQSTQQLALEILTPEEL